MKCQECGHEIGEHIYRKHLGVHKCLFKDCYCNKFEETKEAKE